MRGKIKLFYLSMQEKSKKLLSDHKQIKKKFIPPLKHRVEGLEEVFWSNDVLPELIWIAIINERLGIIRGTEVISSFISDSFAVKKWNHPIDFAFISSFKLFNGEEKSILLNRVNRAEYNNDLKLGLEDFCLLYAENPLEFLHDSSTYKFSEKFVLTLKKIIADNFDRRSQGAMITQTVAYYSILRSGKHHYPSNFNHPDLNAIINGFESEKAKESVGIVRNLINSSFLMLSKYVGNEWVKYFWNSGMKIEIPIIDTFSDGETEITEEIEKNEGSLLVKFIDLINNIVKERWEKLPKDIYNNLSLEVIGGLLSRQASIAISIAKNPGIWDYHIGPILLRTMVDAHINLAWIFTDLENISKQFVEYGLGQEKLEIEHLKHSEVEEQFKEDIEMMIEAKRAWLDYQHFSFLQTVDVGNWSGLTTREMAKKADCENLYKFVYSPYSSCVHNMWNHIGKFNLRHTDNPLHKFIRIPYHPEFNPEMDILIKAAKYFSRSLELLDKKFNIKSSLPNPYDFIIDNLESMNISEDQVKKSL
jgi:hypothetical protein